MKRLVNGVVILLMISNFWLLPYAPLTVQSRQTGSPDRYAAKLRLFEEFVKKQMEKDKIPG